MKTTSKQDRQGVRTASDVERKYNIDEQFKKTNEAIPTSTSQLTNDSGLQNKCNVKSTINDTVDKTFIENTKPEFGLDNLNDEVQTELNKIGAAVNAANAAKSAADKAVENAQTTADLLQALRDGNLPDGAFIDGHNLYAPIIHANELNLYPTTNESATFQILEREGSSGDYYALLRIKKIYGGNLNPLLYFSSSSTGINTVFDFGDVEFSGSISLSGTTLTQAELIKLKKLI